MSLDDKPYPDAPALELFRQFKDDVTNPEFQRDSARALVTRFTEFIDKYKAEYPLLSKINLSQIPKGTIKKYIEFLQELELVNNPIKKDRLCPVVQILKWSFKLWTDIGSTLFWTLRNEPHTVHSGGFSF